jgi:hypothetical protein
MSELAVGDRIQVKYELTDDDRPDDLALVWWGAVVRDKQTTHDQRRIYRLRYDAYPAGGFDEAEERSVELHLEHQMYELEDDLTRGDLQVFRMEPRGEEGVVPCLPLYTKGGVGVSHSAQPPPLEWGPTSSKRHHREPHSTPTPPPMPPTTAAGTESTLPRAYRALLAAEGQGSWTLQSQEHHQRRLAEIYQMHYQYEEERDQGGDAALDHSYPEE